MCIYMVVLYISVQPMGCGECLTTAASLGGRMCVSVCVYMCACVCIVYCKFYYFPITLSLEDNKTINWTLACSADFLGISILQLWPISSYQCECHYPELTRGVR